MTLSRSIVFAKLKQLGITRVDVSFSGGNDSGGADGMTVTYADGTTKDESPFPDVHPRAVQEYRTGNWVVWGDFVPGVGRTHRPATPAEIEAVQWSDALEAPIYNRWGSFAGEFSVSGTLVWDVTAGEVRLTGEEEVSSYETFEEVL